MRRDAAIATCCSNGGPDGDVSETVRVHCAKMLVALVMRASP